MTVTPDELMAYADGKLDGEAAARVAAAIAADPTLAAQIAAVRPDDAVTGRGSDAAAASVPANASPDAAPVLDFAAAKARRERERKTRSKQQKKATKDALPAGRKDVPMFARPGLAAGLAAALVIGVMPGMSLHVERWSNGGWDAGIVERGGRLLATGTLADALDSQPASPAPDVSSPLRILASFRRVGDGAYCRAYEGTGHAGIACHQGRDWVLERVVATLGGTDRTDGYRPTRSAGADLMAAIQKMAAGSSLDTEREQAAIRAGWRR